MTDGERQVSLQRVYWSEVAPGLASSSVPFELRGFFFYLFVGAGVPTQGLAHAKPTSPTVLHPAAVWLYGTDVTSLSLSCCVKKW